MPITAPYGTWRSPVTPELMTGRTVGLGGLAVAGGALLWLESRPGEAGRSTLIRWTPGEGLEELTPAPFDVGDRVHEYGGGSYAAAGGLILLSDKRQGAVWLIEPGAAPREVARVPGCRYADFALDPARRRAIAVREDHRGRPPTDPAAALVALDLSATADPDRNEGLVLVEGPDFLAAPRLSPDGRRLAWIEWDHPAMPWDATRLRVAALDPDGRPQEAVLVAGQEPESVLEPCWTDDSLLFVTDRSGWWNLYAWDEAGTRALAPVAAEIGGPTWQLGSRHFTPLPDGRIAAVLTEAGRRRAVLIDGGRIADLPLGTLGQSPLPFGPGLAAIIGPPDGPPAVVLTERVEGPVARTLRTAGPRLLAPAEISRAEPFDFATTGGAVAHAFFYPPRSAEFAGPAGTLPPLVVLGHGGPTSMAGDGFSLGIQWWTSRGFAVVDVNYRGSTGFGRAYRQLLDGQWGVADVEDCIAAVRHLAEAGRIDPGQVAIRGGSAGGFTVLAALTRSSVFKAGASLYGIGDLALLAHDTHKFEARYLDRLIGPLPAAAALYRARSPVHHLDRLAAPVIFFQGLDDKVVPPNQAETMVEAMAARGLPVAYYAFPGEGHGFRKAETIRRVLELELGFYGRIFGFSPPGLSEAVEVRNLPG